MGLTCPMSSPDASVPVPHSDEQIAHLSHGIDLCFQTFGDPADPALLLVMGLGGPMTWWPAGLCEGFARAGYFVVRYDNRDAGRSTQIADVVTRSMLVRAFLGLPTSAPYSIGDLARDGMGLLAHLNIEKAHVAGVSMGGMIAQTMALSFPDRVLSLTSISSTTGRRGVGWQHPRLFPALLTDRSSSREAYLRGVLRFAPRVGSSAYPEDPTALRLRAEETWDRGVHRDGTMRQMLAVLTQPDRSRDLARVAVPTLVLHGTDDPLVHPSGGRATAHSIPGATLISIAGMGHDLPHGLWEVIVEAVDRNAHRISGG